MKIKRAITIVFFLYSFTPLAQKGGGGLGGGGLGGIFGLTNTCQGAAFNYGASSSSGPYLWSVNGGYIQGASNGSSITIIWTSSGIGSVNLTYNNGLSSANLRVFINPKIKGNIILMNDVCYNGSAQLIFNDASSIIRWEESINNNDWTSINNSSSSQIMTSFLTSSRYFRVVYSSDGCTNRITNPILVTVSQSLSPGSINGTKTICYNSSAGTLGNLSSPTGGDNIYAYQWQISSSSGGTYSNISGASAATYTPGNLTVTKYFRRRVISCGETKYSNIVTVSARPTLNPGSINGTKTICYNSSAGTLGNTSSPTGGNSSYTYQWQISSSSGGTYSNISGATSATYSPGNLTTTRYYRRRVISCGETKYSNVVAVIVDNQLQVTAGNI